MAAHLREIRRCQIDGDTFWRKAKPKRAERTPHPFARLADGFIREANDHEGRKSGTDLHLHVDILDVDAGERDGVAAREAEGRGRA